MKLLKIIAAFILVVILTISTGFAIFSPEGKFLNPKSVVLFGFMLIAIALWIREIYRN